MKSRKRKNSSHILVALGKSITSAFALDLVMLFCHAGAEVKTALLPGAEDYVTTASLQQLSPHQVYLENHQPKWVSGPCKFDLTFFICPTEEQKQIILSGSSANPFIGKILEKSRRIIIADEQRLPDSFVNESPDLISFFQLSPDPRLAHQAMHRLFAEAIEKLAKAAQTNRIRGLINLPPSGDNSQTTWLVQLQEAAVHNGIQLVKDLTDPYDFCIEACEAPTIDEDTLPDSLRLSFLPQNELNKINHCSSNQVFLTSVEKGIILFDIHGFRLLPALSTHSPFNRLIRYIIDRLAAVNPVSEKS